MGVGVERGAGVVEHGYGGVIVLLKFTILLCYNFGQNIVCLLTGGKDCKIGKWVL